MLSVIEKPRLEAILGCFQDELPAWLRRAIQASSSTADIENAVLLHGTVEPFTIDLQPGGYDGICWTTTGRGASTIAQSYIPESHGTIGYAKPYGQIDIPMPPGNYLANMILEAHGYDLADFDAVYDQAGRCQSWKIIGQPTEREAWEWVGTGLGYDLSANMVEIKTSGNHLMPACYRAPGRLFIIEKPDNLRIYDRASKSSGDLLDPQYHDIGSFRAAEAAGYDGITISDHHHTKRMGTFGHSSIGLFPKTLARLKKVAIPAVHACPLETGWLPTFEFRSYTSQ